AVTTIVTARSARAVAPVATVAARRVVLLFLADLGEVEDLALVDPHLDADDPVGGPRLGEAVVDVRAQGMQRHAALAVPLRTRDLGAVQAAGHVDLDTQRTQAHRVADGALHRAAEHDAALELLGDRLGHQLRVQLRLADLGDVDVRRDAHHVAHFLAQLLDVLAALADHHARAGGVDGHARGLGRTLDQDPADPGLRQLLAQHLADLEVGGQVLGVFLLAGVPLGVPVLGDTEANAGGMNFMTHVYLPFPVASPTTTVMWLVRLRMRVPRPLARAMKRFSVGPSSTMIVVTDSSSTSAPWLFSALAIADSTTLRIRWAA